MDLKDNKDEGIMMIVLFWPIWVPALLIIIYIGYKLMALGQGW
jgi:hypothetical protein